MVFPRQKIEREENDTVKNFKRIMLVGACSIMLALSLTGCRKNADCSFCEKKDVPCTEEEVAGQTYYYCEDCEEALDALNDMLD